MPASHIPYVWVFPANGRIGKKKPPEKLFHENDMYTIRLPNGGRNLVLEHGLGGLESKFGVIREKIELKQTLSEDERLNLCAFTAAMRSRTRSQRDHMRKEWGRILEKSTAIIQNMKGRPHTSAPAPTSFSKERRGFTQSDVEKLAKEPLQHMLDVMISKESAGLYILSMVIFEAEKGSMFITSDSPCVWFDPEAHKRHPFYQAPALVWPSLEVTLPISPKHALFFSYNKKFNGYRGIRDNVVQEINRRTRFHAYEYYVTNQNISSDYWFQEDTRET